jgi:hypothetical protein
MQEVAGSIPAPTSCGRLAQRVSKGSYKLETEVRSQDPQLSSGTHICFRCTRHTSGLSGFRTTKGDRKEMLGAER